MRMQTSWSGTGITSESKTKDWSYCLTCRTASFRHKGRWAGKAVGSIFSLNLMCNAPPTLGVCICHLPPHASFHVCMPVWLSIGLSVTCVNSKCKRKRPGVRRASKSEGTLLKPWSRLYWRAFSGFCRVQWSEHFDLGCELDNIRQRLDIFIRNV